MSSDHIWQPIYTTRYPSLSNLKTTNPSVPYHCLYALGLSAANRRLKPPPKPEISLQNLIFTIDFRVKGVDSPPVIISRSGDELTANEDGVFRFDLDLEFCEGLSVWEEEEVRITWNVVLCGWRGVFRMMDWEGKVRGIGEGWFSEELPCPGCCSSDVASGIVVDLKLGFCRGGSEEEGRVERMSLGILSIVNWRYVSVEDGLRYLQHFLLNTTAH